MIGGIVYLSVLGLLSLTNFLFPNVTTSLHYSLSFLILWFFYKGFRRFCPWALFKIKNIHLEVHSVLLHPGETIPFNLTFEGRYPVHIRKITASLICQEEAVSGSGKSSTTSHNILFKEEKIYLKETRIGKEEPQEILDSFKLPEDIPYFLDLNSNKVKCFLSFEFYLKYSLTSILNQYLIVLPLGYLPHPKSNSMQAILKKSRFPYFRLF